MSQCCVSGFEWEGKPVGKEIKLGELDAYVTGANKEVGFLLAMLCQMADLTVNIGCNYDSPRRLLMGVAESSSLSRSLRQGS